jgi:hypothetical protein
LELPVKRRTVRDILSNKETYESVWCRNVRVNKFDDVQKLYLPYKQYFPYVIIPPTTKL